MNAVSLRPWLAVACTLMLVACARNEPAPEPIRAVRTMTIAADSAGGQLEYAADVRARVESRLGFRVGGKMTARMVEVGQRVNAGQALARLDSNPMQSAGHQIVHDVVAGCD